MEKIEGITMERSKTFIQHLYKEKEIHKEHRHRHVIHKLFLTSSFFGLGQLSKSDEILNLFLYIVPIIAIVHDIYVFAEHEKIRRIGLFIRKFKNVANSSICPEEIAWEEFAKNNREKWAVIGSLIYTCVITAFSALAIARLETQGANGTIFKSWLYLMILLIVIVFFRITSLKIKFENLEGE